MAVERHLFIILPEMCDSVYFPGNKECRLSVTRLLLYAKKVQQSSNLSKAVSRFAAAVMAHEYNHSREVLSFITHPGEQYRDCDKKKRFSKRLAACILTCAGLTGHDIEVLDTEKLRKLPRAWWETAYVAMLQLQQLPAKRKKLVLEEEVDDHDAPGTDCSEQMDFSCACLRQVTNVAPLPPLCLAYVVVL
jgi:hypothetical protein